MSELLPAPWLRATPWKNLLTGTWWDRQMGIGKVATCRTCCSREATGYLLPKMRQPNYSGGLQLAGGRGTRRNGLPAVLPVVPAQSYNPGPECSPKCDALGTR